MRSTGLVGRYHCLSSGICIISEDHFPPLKEQTHYLVCSEKIHVVWCYRLSFQCHSGSRARADLSRRAVDRRRKQPTLHLQRDSRVATGLLHDTLTPFPFALVPCLLPNFPQLIPAFNIPRTPLARLNDHFYNTPHIARAPLGLNPAIIHSVHDGSR